MSGIESRIGVKSLPFVNKPGINFIFKLIFEDGSGEILRESAIPVFIDAEIKDCDQRLGERIIEGINLEYHPNLDLIQRVLSEKNRLRKSAEHYVSNKIENIKREIEKEREPKIENELDSLEKYERSERQRLQKFIEKYKDKQEKGEEMEISIRRQKYRLDRLEERIEARRTELEKKLNIIALGPELIGCCIALPG